MLLHAVHLQIADSIDLLTCLEFSISQHGKSFHFWDRFDAIYIVYMLVMLVILYDFHEMLALKKEKKHNIFDTYVLKSNSYNLHCL